MHQRIILIILEHTGSDASEVEYIQMHSGLRVESHACHHSDITGAAAALSPNCEYGGAHDHGKTLVQGCAYLDAAVCTKNAALVI